MMWMMEDTTVGPRTWISHFLFGFFEGCTHPMNPMTSLLHLLGWAMLIFCHRSSMGTAMGDALILWHSISACCTCTFLMPFLQYISAKVRSDMKKLGRPGDMGRIFICRILCGTGCDYRCFLELQKSQKVQNHQNKLKSSLLYYLMIQPRHFQHAQPHTNTCN